MWNIYTCLNRNRNFNNINGVFLFIVLIFGAHLEAAVSGFINFLHLFSVIENLCAARKIGSFDNVKNSVYRCFRIFKKRNCGITDFSKIKRANRACHTNRNTEVRGNENIGESRRQKRGLRQRVIVVWNEIDGILINIRKKLLTKAIELCLRVS